MWLCSRKTSLHVHNNLTTFTSKASSIPRKSASASYSRGSSSRVQPAPLHVQRNIRRATCSDRQFLTKRIVSSVSPALRLQASPQNRAYRRAYDCQHPYRRRLHLQKSSVGSAVTLTILIATIGTAFCVVYPEFEEKKVEQVVELLPKSALRLPGVLLEEDMADKMPEGRPGNLTAEQEAKLKEQWRLLLQVFGVLETSAEPRPSVEQTATAEPAAEKKKSRFSLFRREKEEAPAPTSTGTSPGGIDLSKIDENDKHGLGKDMKALLTTTKPEEIREAFWTMVKMDHPDALCLRFLRARKWDDQAALLMTLATLQWRWKEMKVDSDIMFEGEAGALEKAQTADEPIKRQRQDFMDQLRQGKSYLHGADKEGRPMCFVRVKLHHGGEQTLESLERITVHMIETARFSLRPPADTATIVFDMTGFTLANMDYAPVKFMIKCFEANYPECLGTVLVHNSPWVFQGIWKVIRGWLDPVVAGKVHFTNGADGLAEFIPRDRIPKEHDGEEDWKYEYVEPRPGENKQMQDTKTRDEIGARRQELYKQYEAATIKWIRGDDTVKEERTQLAEKIKRNYWELDPYIRARSLYDRMGVIKAGGDIEFYPRKENIPTQTSTTTHEDLD